MHGVLSGRFSELSMGPGNLSLLAGAFALVGLGLGSVSDSLQRGVPDGYEQILPRGKIAAISNPTYVTASEATIRDEAWVLGLLIDGQARAFSLALLNNHEVVNDTIGGTDFAAVW